MDNFPLKIFSIISLTFCALFATIALFLLSIYASIGANTILTEAVLPKENSIVALGTGFVSLTFNCSFMYLLLGIWVVFILAFIWIFKEEIAEALKRFDEWRHLGEPRKLIFKIDCKYFLPLSDGNGNIIDRYAFCKKTTEPKPMCTNLNLNINCQDCKDYQKRE